MKARHFLFPRNRRHRRVRNQAALALIAAVLGLSLLSWLAFGTGPRRVTREDVERVTLEPAAVTELREQANTLAEAFEEKAKEDGFAPTEADLELLREAIRKMDEVVSKSGEAVLLSDLHRHEALRERYGTLAAAALYEDSIEAEAEARRAAANGDNEAAQAALRRALELQARINRDFYAARQANPRRADSLVRQLERMEAAPLVDEAMTSIAEGERLFSSGELLPAKRQLQGAQQILMRLADEFPTLASEQNGRRERAESVLREVEAAGLAKDARAMARRAQELADLGDLTSAAAMFGRAIEAQREVNLKYPASKAASPSAVEELERDLQTAMSAQTAVQLRAALSELDAALPARRELAATEAIGSAFAAVIAIEGQFPKSRHLDPQTALRIKFLQRLKGDLGPLQSAFMDHLQPIPGIPGRAIYDREVSQLLFAKIMGSNPSVTGNDMLPVEGVTLDEAKEFARRLSWILGRDVSVPTWEEYMAVVEPVDPAYVREGTWHGASTTDRTTQPVASSRPNARGCYDLLGNVSEWLLPESPESSTAFVAGGSVRDNPISLAKVPIETRPAIERVRYNGFRVTVAVD